MVILSIKASKFEPKSIFFCLGLTTPQGLAGAPISHPAKH